MNNRRENITVIECTAEQEFTVGNSDGGPAVKESVVNVKTLERFFNVRSHKEMGKIVNTFDDKI